ncbi:hypothetical protein E4U42_006255, partial [Claviceps africana]
PAATRRLRRVRPHPAAPRRADCEAGRVGRQDAQGDGPVGALAQGVAHLGLLCRFQRLWLQDERHGRRRGALRCRYRGHL